MTHSPAICMKRVSFSYNSTSIIENAELCIDENAFVSIVGPNGGGKTTLLKLILGLIKPNSGTVQVFGENPQLVRKQIGYVPQRAHFDPHFPISIMDVVLTGRLGTTGSSYIWGAEDKGIAARSLAEVGLEAHGTASFSELSGGQQQRVLIARALACQPRMLLLDEPTANLDRIVESHLYKLLKQLSEKLTVVLVSHDLGFVSKFVDLVVCVNRDVHIHPTADLSKEIINELYGTDVKLVRHDVEEAGVHHHE